MSLNTFLHALQALAGATGHDGDAKQNGQKVKEAISGQHCILSLWKYDWRQRRKYIDRQHMTKSKYDAVFEAALVLFNKYSTSMLNWF